MGTAGNPLGRVPRRSSTPFTVADLPNGLTSAFYEAFAEAVEYHLDGSYAEALEIYTDLQSQLSTSLRELDYNIEIATRQTS